MPRYANPAINFATDDMGSDKAMGGVLLDILIVIIAFIFAVTISNTIVKEASTIGTLRASGYTRGELVRHYISMPVIVTVVASVLGNVQRALEISSAIPYLKMWLLACIITATVFRLIRQSGTRMPFSRQRSFRLF